MIYISIISAGDCHCKWLQKYWRRQENGIAGIFFPLYLFLLLHLKYFPCFRELVQQFFSDAVSNLFKWFYFFQSLPVAFGIDAAKWICVGAIDITQISVAGTLNTSYKLLFVNSFFVNLKLGCGFNDDDDIFGHLNLSFNLLYITLLFMNLSSFSIRDTMSGIISSLV